MDNKTKIVAATPSDLSDVLELLTAVNLPHDGVREYLESFLLVRDTEDGLIGCAGLEQYEGVGLLRSVAVAPHLQKTGAGSRLVASMIQRARSAGLVELVLLTTTSHDFFAQRFGFVDADRTDYETILAQSPEWTLPRCSSAAFMRLDLSPDANA
jgi:amino-acid N-acetyltransferase